MVRKVVTVDEALHLPDAVREQVSADLVSDMQGYVDSAQTASTSAGNSATAAGVARDEAVAAASSVTIPADSAVAGYVNNTNSATYAAVNSKIAAASAAEVSRADAAYSRGEIGYAQITSGFDMPAGRTVDVTGLSVTVTVGDKPVLVEAFLDMQKASTSAGFLVAYLFEGATQLQQAQDYRADMQPTTVRPAVRLTPTAGTHTYKVAVLSNVGAASVRAQAGISSWIRVTEQ